MTADCPSDWHFRMNVWIAISQGSRSSSVKGVPELILATLAGGWNPSPSRKVHPSRSAKRFPTVDFPEPDTPMTTTTMPREYGPLIPPLQTFHRGPPKNFRQLERQLLERSASTNRELGRFGQGKCFTVTGAFQNVPGFWHVAGCLHGIATDGDDNDMQRQTDEQSC